MVESPLAIRTTPFSLVTGDQDAKHWKRLSDRGTPVMNVVKTMLRHQIFPATNRHTEVLIVRPQKSVHIVKKFMSACQHCQCIFWRIIWSIHATFVTSHFLVHGYFRVTEGHTQERNHLDALIVVKPLPIGLIFGLTCKRILLLSITRAKDVTNRSLSSRT